MQLFDINHQIVIFIIQPHNISWYYSLVCVSTSLLVCTLLWDYISNHGKSIIRPWLLIGDLNEIINPSNALSGTFNPSKALLMASIYVECGFIDMGTIGGNFTRRKNTQSRGLYKKMARLLPCV